MSTVADSLAEARGKGLDRLDAQLLLAHVLARPRSWLLANDEARLNDGQRKRWLALLERRAEGEPMAYLLGEKEFHGLTFHVSPAVLVPRPDTETVVDWALELMPGFSAVPGVLDMGTGSGAIALAIKHKHPRARVTAIDASAAALAVAQENAKRLQLDVEFLLSDWWQAVTGPPFDLIVSNPPYVAAADHHLHALRHEPLMALTPGGDGLGALRHIAAGARLHLNPGGWLLLEHGHDQAPAVQALLGEQGFHGIASRHDLAGHARCTGGRRG